MAVSLTVPVRLVDVPAEFNEIGAGLTAAVPQQRQPVYAGLAYEPADFPVSKAAARSILSLPMHSRAAGSVEKVDAVGAVT
jgi:dTDP-4-amino-4,6-dideoxygalactose transaminase